MARSKDDKDDADPRVVAARERMEAALAALEDADREVDAAKGAWLRARMQRKRRHVEYERARDALRSARRTARRRILQ